jgi:MFS family permease
MTGEIKKPSRKRLPRNVWVVTLTSFLMDISSEMVINLIPLFLANVLGVRTAIVGLIEGVAETTASLLKMYSGWLSDKLARRKVLAVIGYGFSALVKPLLFFASSWTWVLGVRFGDRVGKGIRTAPRDALVAASVDEKQRGLAFGLHRAGDTAGAMLGLIIAAIVIWATQAGSTSLSRETFQTIVLVSIIPAVLAVLVIALGAREVVVKADSADSSLSLSGMDKRFKFFLFSVVFFSLGNSSDAFIVLRGQERGLSVLQVMGMLITFAAVYSLLSGPFGALSDRVGRRRLILLGWSAYALIYLCLALSKTGWQVWVLYAVYGIYYAATEGTAKALVADLVPREKRGTAYGLFNGAIGLTALPASLIAGILWQGVGSWMGFGSHAPFYFGALMALLGGVIFWKGVR